MPAVKITNKPIGIPGDDTHFIVTQPELPEGYTPTGQETEEELAELKVESLREIEMDDMVELFQSKFAFDSEPTAESNKPVTSAGIKAALDAADDEIDELKENLSDLQELADTKAAAIYETASGEIASFSDGADDMPIKSCVVKMEPVQDLHGYDNPWPAGGGKNLVDADVFVNGDVIVKNANGSYTLTMRGTLAAQRGTPIFDIKLSADKTYFLSFDYSNLSFASGDMLSYRVFENGAWQSGHKIALSNNRGETSIIHASDVTQMQIYMGNSDEYIGDTITFSNFQIEEGDTATAYQPCSNICPISGRTGLSVTRCGKNLLPALASAQTKNGISFTPNADGSYTLSGTATATAIFYLSQYGDSWKTGRFRLSGCPNGGGNSIYALRVYSSGGMGYATDFGSGVEFDGAENLRVGIVVWSGVTIDKVFYPMISFANSDSGYEPYKSDTYSVNWETEAGESYGATLDVVSGKLRVEWIKGLEISNYDANLTDLGSTLRTGIVYFGRSGFPTVLPSIYGNAYSNILLARSPGYDSDKPGFYFYNSTGGYLFFPKSSLSTPDANGVNALLAQTPFYVVYKLATPFEIQLTPQEITTLFRTLLGENNIWSDAGSMAVEYPADTKIYIDTKIAEAVAAAMA